MTTYNSPFAGDVVQPIDVSYAAYSITADTTLVWPINGNSSSYVAARIMQISPSSSTLNLYMPPANQVSVGQDALLVNPSAFTLNVKDSAGGTICSIAAGLNKYIYVTTNDTVAGTWGVTDFGNTTSAPNASVLAGYGLLAINNTLNQSHPTSGLSDAYTYTSADRAQTRIWSGGVGTGTVPAASSLGDNWFVLFKNNGTGTYTLSASGTNTIDAAATKIFQPNESAFIICTGSGYVTVGYGASNLFAFTVLVKNVTTGAYTLTSTEAKNTIQEYTGTLTGNVTVTYPPVVNLYVVSNQCTAGSYTLTLTTGVSGGTNAVIPAGAQATLICDGTNFLNANTVQAGATAISLINGTAANPALNFASETNTGVYRPSAGQWAISILGSQVFAVSAVGIGVTGTGNFSGGISGGAF
jgi:hypothetical protein